MTDVNVRFVFIEIIHIVFISLSKIMVLCFEIFRKEFLFLSVGIVYSIV